LNCHGENGRKTLTELLHEGGLLHSAAKCHIANDEIRTFPELHGVTQAEHAAPKFYPSDKNSILSNHETQQLEEMITSDTRALDEIRSQVTAPRQTLDVDSLLLAHHGSSLREKQTHYHLIILTVICTVTIIGILCLFLRSFLRKVHYAISKPAAATQISPPSTPAPRHDTLEARDEPRKNIVFTSYAALLSE
jgi:hypothetical protein